MISREIEDSLRRIANHMQRTGNPRCEEEARNILQVLNELMGVPSTDPQDIALKYSLLISVNKLKFEYCKGAAQHEMSTDLR